MAFCCLKPTTGEGPSKSAKGKKDIRRSGHDLLQNRDMDTSLLNGMNSLAFSDIQLDTNQSLHTGMSQTKSTGSIKQVSS